MIRRPPPGVLVATGRLRVDGARAVAKLRAFRLADPAAWILEAVRAAVASGATAIELGADSDELWLRWAGPPWLADELPALLDELVSPEEERGYHRRLLGSAVNSALGLDPVSLELTVAEPDGARGVRFSVEELEDVGPAGEPVLKAPAVIPLAVPPALASGASCAVQLHLRYPSGLRTIWRRLRGGELPELTLARKACADLSVPMTINGERVASRDDLLRLPLGEDLGGFLALTVPGEAPSPEVAVAELGVVISRSHWFGARVRWLRGDAPPVRLHFNADRLVTNAARSAVDETEPPVSTAKERGVRLLDHLIDKLAEQLRQPDAAPALRECALAILAGVAGTADWAPALAGAAPIARQLASAPLVYNAVGELRSALGPWARPVYRGKRPLPAELAPWLTNLAWIPPGDPAQRLLHGSDGHAREANEIIKQARRAKATRDSFFARPPGKAHVAPSAEAAITLTIDERALAGEHSAVPADSFVGLRGEVALIPSWDTARVALWYHGRLLETLMLPAPLPFDIALDTEALTPDLRCRAAERDEAFDRTLRVARLAAVRAVEVLCTRTAGAPDEVLAPLVRRACQALVAEQLGVPRRSPLALVPAWPAHGAAPLALDQLRREIAVAIFDPLQEHVVSPAGRVAVRLSASEAGCLMGLLDSTAATFYGPFAAAPSRDPAAEPGRRHLARGASLILLVREPGRAGAISLAEHGELVLMHRGTAILSRQREGAYFSCDVTVDSEDICPDASWRNVLAGEDLATRGLDAWERAYIVAAARALVGEDVADFVAGRPSDRLLVAALVAVAPEKREAILGGELCAALAGRPLFVVTGCAERVSAAALVELFPGALSAVTEQQLIGAGLPPKNTFLVADEAYESLARWLTGRPLASGVVQLASEAGEAARAQRLAHHLMRPSAVLALPEGAFAFPVTHALFHGVVGAAEPSGQRVIEVQVWHAGRPAFEIRVHSELGFAAAIEVDPKHFNDNWTDLAPLVTADVISELRKAIVAWLHAMIEDHPGELVEIEKPCMLLVDFFRLRGPRMRDPMFVSLPPELHERLRAAPLWPVARGGRVSAAQASADGNVNAAFWYGRWLPPRAGSAPSTLDGPLIALPEDRTLAKHWFDILECLTGTRPRDVSAATLLLQDARRLEVDGAAQVAAEELDRDRIDGPSPLAPPLPPPRRVRKAGAETSRAALREAGLLDDDGTVTPPLAVDLTTEQLMSLRAAPISAVPSSALPRTAILPKIVIDVRMTSSTSAPSQETPPRAEPPVAATPHPMQPLAEALAGRLRELCGRVLAFASFVIVDDRVAPMVAIVDDRVELAGRAPELSALAVRLARAPAAAEPAVVALLAYLASELNRAHTAVTDLHEQRILFELLSQGATAAAQRPR